MNATRNTSTAATPGRAPVVRTAGPNLTTCCLAPLCLIALLCGLAAPSEASSWLINQAQYHISVHGSLGCADCHSDIADAKTHPDPAAVTKPLTAFFKADQCLGCHGDVTADLAKGSHAGKPVLAGQDYQACLTCHDPHYQLGAKPRPAGFVAGKPVEQQCGACHDKRTALPPLAKDDAACMACHQAQPASAPAAREAVNRLCLDCHGAGLDKFQHHPVPGLAAMDAAALAGASHKTLACLACHRDAAKFEHDKQQRTACLDCHPRHDASVARDVHLGVSCEACHLSGISPVRATAGGTVTARLDRSGTGPLLVHSMTLPPGEKSCTRCHAPGNPVGASATVLPAKSILCLPCHAATFSVAGDPITGLSLLVFLAGLAFLGVFWFSPATLGNGAKAKAAAAPEAPAAPKPAVDWGHVLRVAGSDIFLQGRLYRESPRRWAIHALIYFPFVFRFLWGIIGLLGSQLAPRTALPWLLLDVNNPLGAFLFDLSGLALLLGLLLAGLDWYRRRDQADIAGLPRHDWPALILLAAIVVVGFVLEAMRIAMTGLPAGSAYAFLGHALAGCFLPAGPGLTGAYGTVWYVHALLTGATVAYLPFSQLRHVLMAPLVMLLEAARNEK